MLFTSISDEFLADDLLDTIVSASPLDFTVERPQNNTILLLNQNTRRRNPIRSARPNNLTEAPVSLLPRESVIYIYIYQPHLGEIGV